VPRRIHIAHRFIVWLTSLPLIAQGATVTVTLTGHVDKATDGYGNLFTTTGKPTPLDNLPFTLVFTFDDALTTPYIAPPCGGGMLYYTQSSGTDISPTAILTIDGKPFTVGGGGMGEVAGSWYALKYAAVPCSDYPTGAASYSVSAIYNSGGYNGTTRVTSLALEGASVFPASDSNFGPDHQWWSPLPTTNTDKSSLRAFGFYITYSYSSVPGRESPRDYIVDVMGSLAPETLTVNSGPESCPAVSSTTSSAPLEGYLQSDVETDARRRVCPFWWCKDRRAVNFIKSHLADAQSLAAQLRVPVEFVLAVSEDESRFGTSDIALMASNYFGFWAGGGHSTGTYITSGGTGVSSYNGLPDPYVASGQDFVDSEIGNPSAVGTTDVLQFFTAIHNKYARGSTTAQYVRKMISVARTTACG
jgi:hypothetical protein